MINQMLRCRRLNRDSILRSKLFGPPIMPSFVPQMLFNMFNSVLGLNLLGAAGTPRELPSCFWLGFSQFVLSTSVRGLGMLGTLPQRIYLNCNILKGFWIGFSNGFSIGFSNAY